MTTTPAPTGDQTGGQTGDQTGDQTGGPSDGETLLIYAPVPLHRAGGRPDGALTLEGQACNGLRLWAENFGRVISMMPLAEGPPPPDWVPLTEVGPSLERIRIEPMPVAWRPDRFLRALPAARRRIRALIDEADYLSFSIGGLFGDWGSVACVEARRMGRPVAERGKEPA